MKWANQMLKKYNNDYHKAARAWNKGEPVAEKDPNAGKAYADDIVKRMKGQ
jgi:septum formation inhibitor-activating ATPase MinD